MRTPLLGRKLSVAPCLPCPPWQHDRPRREYPFTYRVILSERPKSIPESKLMLPSSQSSRTYRTASIPNRKGTKALYSVTTQNPDSFAHETRVLDLPTGTSTVFSNDTRTREVKWLGTEDTVLWLKDADGGMTEFWVGDASDILHSYSHCAGRIGARASNLKLKRLFNEYDDVAIVVSCPATETGALHNPEAELSGTGTSPQIQNALWYTTLRKRTIENATLGVRFVLSPSKFTNALRGTGLESPLPDPLGSSDDFDLSSSGLVFLSQDAVGGSTNYPSINSYFVPLKTFTELSRPRPQLISVRQFDGRSSCPVFSPNGSSIAFLKKKHPIDQNDRNRVVVINNIREFRAHLSIEDMRTQQSEKDWHLSPYSVTWSDNGKELYVVAVDQGIRRLFKIPAALASIRTEPEPITSESKTPADVRHLRMVFSAPMETPKTNSQSPG